MVMKSGGGDNFANVGTVLGTAYNDHLVGSTSTSTSAIDGIRLDGELGNDVIDGKASNLNRADYTDSPNAVVVQLQTSGNSSSWAGTASDGWGTTDVLQNVSGVYGSALADSITGSNQDDAIQGWYGNDTLDGGAGTDTALYWTNQAQASWARTMAGGAWDGSWTITSPYGTDILRHIERL
jgi:hypothetical protein